MLDAYTYRQNARFRIIKVPDRIGRALHDEFAGLTQGREATVRAHHFDNDAGQDPASAARRAQVLVELRERNRRARLGHAYESEIKQLNRGANDAPNPCPICTAGNRAASWLVSSAESGAAPLAMKRTLLRSNFLTAGCCVLCVGVLLCGQYKSTHLAESHDHGWNNTGSY